MKNNRPTGQIVRLGHLAFITVVINGLSYTIREQDDSTKFANALAALKAENWDQLYEILAPVEVKYASVSGVTVTRKGVTWNGMAINGTIADRLMQFAEEGLPYEPLSKFLDKLMQNPSKRATEELYTFLEHKNLPITDNGNFLAYKKINSDWYSVTSGKVTLLTGKANANGQIYNGIGEEITIPRNQVNDDKEVHCSYGLHAGTIEYAKGFSGSKLVIVEINPADVVSIPSDYNCSKLRTCRYKVVGEYEEDLRKALYQSQFNDTADLHFEVDSSWIDSIEYTDSVLTINKMGGGTIVHTGVPRTVAMEWQSIDQAGGSSGAFYNQKVRNIYPTL